MLLLEGVTLTQDARQLNGSERVVLDGLLTPAECGVLLQLAKVRRPVSRWRPRPFRDLWHSIPLLPSPVLQQLWRLPPHTTTVEHVLFLST